MWQPNTPLLFPFSHSAGDWLWASWLQNPHSRTVLQPQPEPALLSARNSFSESPRNWDSFSEASHGCIMFFQVWTTDQFCQNFWLSSTQYLNILYRSVTGGNMDGNSLGYHFTFCISFQTKSFVLTFTGYMVLHFQCIYLRYCKFPIDVYLHETNVQMKNLGAETICAVNC